MRETIPQLLLNMFESRMIDHNFRWFREGDPIAIPSSNLPALLITQEEAEWETDATGFDKVTHKIFIQVVLDKKSDLGNKDSAKSIDKRLEQIVQGRNDDGTLLDNSIMGALRNNFSINNLAINNLSTVRKGLLQRTEKLLTAEAHIDLLLTELVPVSSRS